MHHRKISTTEGHTEILPTYQPMWLQTIEAANVSNLIRKSSFIFESNKKLEEAFSVID